MNAKVPWQGKDKQETEKRKREEASDDHCSRPAPQKIDATDGGMTFKM